MGAAMGTWVLFSASWYKMGEIYAREGELECLFLWHRWSAPLGPDDIRDQLSASIDKLLRRLLGGVGGVTP